ncbi:MAG: hypothetical protein EBV10_10630 [Synechococcaceae bacterium WB6_1A_059]|nr:hypothetical protein [Synechococcaceae bacterium WB6_1A_059]
MTALIPAHVVENTILDGITTSHCVLHIWYLIREAEKAVSFFIDLNKKTQYNLTMKTCRNCRSQINDMADRCPYCTTEVDMWGIPRRPETSPKLSVQQWQQVRQIQQDSPNAGGAGWVLTLFLSLALSSWIDSLWPLGLWCLALVVAFVSLIFRS